MMQNYLRPMVRSYWFNTLAVAVILSLLIWFFGPLLAIGQVHPFDSETIRLITIAGIAVLFVVLNVLHVLNARRREKKLVDNVVAAEPDADATASAEEIALLGERLKEALQKLKKVPGGRRGRRRLYELPWYMFIGPPGAGKTTALVNSGLNFPLADAAGPTALRGVGGTRNCEWWFTDQAVLIDTAGRYTTQDSQAAVDGAAWLGFLRLLKKHRRRQPLNGVLLAIGLSDLAALSEAERLSHAHAMRKRMRELGDELGVRVPVYVLFTKTDLIAGFVEFFDNLGREEREQVWGMTLKLDDGKFEAGREEGGAVAQFGAEFDLLVARLNEGMLERVNQETDIQRRRLIYGFPQQIASMRGVASDFLTEIFRPSRLEARPLLRGIYFTSGTQDGTPIDRLLGVMAGQFGLQRQAVTAFSGAGRSYFLTRLMRDVVFGEAALVSLDPRVERRTRWTYRAAYATAILLLLVFTAGWTGSYIGNREMIDEAHGAAAKYNEQFAALLKRGPRDVDLRAVLPALATLRGMRGGYDQREASTPLTLTFGLYQGDKISAAAIEAYYRALNSLLLPRLLARLELDIAANIDKPDTLYELLKTYLILGRQGRINRDTVGRWLSDALNRDFPFDEDAPDREALLQHTEAMEQRPLTAIPLNGPLIARARETLTRVPLAEYTYNRIINAPAITGLPEWTIADNGGAGAGRVFTRRSGAPISTGMPGIFTWAGYHNAFLPALPTVTQNLQEDSWVLGRERRGGISGELAEANKLRRDVIGIYLDEYVRRWDRLLGDIAVKPFSTLPLSDAADLLGLMSGPNSPLRTLLTAIDAQTQLSRTGATDAAQAQLEAKAAKIGQRAAGLGSAIGRTGLSYGQNEIASMLGEAISGTPGGGATPVDPTSRVDEHFRAFHTYTFGTREKPAPMEAAIERIGAIYQGMIQVNTSPNPGDALIRGAAGAAGGAAGPTGPAAAASQLQQATRDMPGPVAALMQSVAQSSSALGTDGAISALQTAWKTKVLPLCDAAFLTRYPFVASSTEDTPTDDFAKLLAPGGLMDQFFNDNLKGLVNTTTSPWKWQAANNNQLGLKPETLVQFENAAKIRDSLFNGAPQIAVRFTLLPTNLDAGVAQITLDVAGQSLTYNHGPTESTPLQWPGQGGKTLMRVTMTPAAGGNAQVTEKDGPWALLHLLDTAKIVPSPQPDKFSLTFTSPAGNASFQLNANSVRNPFTLTALRNFRCPPTL
jgi:type VI secretion system protein ImpL